MVEIIPKKEYRISRFWIILAVISLIINIFLFISKWIDTSQFVALVKWVTGIAGIVAIIYLLLQSILKRRGIIDAYKVKDEIIRAHFEGTGQQLDDSRVEIEERTPNSFLVEFTNEAKTFTYRDGVVKGFETRTLRKRREDIERSKFWDRLLAKDLAEEKLKEAAEEAGFKIPGITDGGDKN